MASLNPTIEKFYLDILDFAGLKSENAKIVNKDDTLGDITIDAAHLYLPYYEVLKNPPGHIFHLLNENYANPETSQFKTYKSRLTLELNLKLSYMIINLVTIANDSILQNKVKSTKLIELLTNIGEIDMGVIDTFMQLIKASKKVNETGYLVDIYLKKNGSIGNDTFSAIGKINFKFYKEIVKALADKENGYRAFGVKCKKKDLVALCNIFEVLFDDINNEEKYTCGTDNRIFRFLDVLLRSAYIVASKINDLTELLSGIDDESLRISECKFNLDWVETLPKLYNMAQEIRLIPSQTNIEQETKHKLADYKSDKDNSVVNDTNTYTPQQPPQVNQPQVSQPQPQSFNPNMVAMTNAQNTAVAPQPQNTQPPQPLSPEDIIKASLNAPQYPVAPNVAMMQPMPMMQPMMPQQLMMPQQPVPSWVMAQSPQMQPMYPMQPMQPMQPMMQPMQPMQPMMQPMMPASSLQLNPMFLQGRPVGFN